MENKILVFYINVARINSEDIDMFVHDVAKRITPKTFNGEVIIIPTITSDTKVECINPKYITEKDLIQEHENLMNELNNKLHEQLKLMKNEES